MKYSLLLIAAFSFLLSSNCHSSANTDNLPLGNTDCLKLNEEPIGAHFSIPSNKDKINALKNQLAEKLRAHYKDGDYRESVFVGLKGCGTNQIKLFLMTNDYSEDLDLSYEYKINLKDIEKVQIGEITDNVKGACGIKIFMKKKCSYTHIQQKPTYYKAKRNFFSIFIKSSRNRADMIEAEKILSELLDAVQ